MPELQPQWWWLVIAAVLAIAEIIAPGIFLIWLAAAAAITGFVTWLTPGLPESMPVQLVLFAVLAFASIYVGRTVMRRNPTVSADPLLNNRAARLVGETAIVIEAISGGIGRVQVGDSPWPASGPDAFPGERVRIIGADGNRLKVERLKTPEA